MPLNKETKPIINTLDTIEEGNKPDKYSPLAVDTFFTLLASIVFCKFYKNFHFISNLRLVITHSVTFLQGYNNV